MRLSLTKAAILTIAFLSATPAFAQEEETKTPTPVPFIPPPSVPANSSPAPTENWTKCALQDDNKTCIIAIEGEAEKEGILYVPLRQADVFGQGAFLDIFDPRIAKAELKSKGP